MVNERNSGPQFEPISCLACGYPIDSASEVSGTAARPEAGSLSVCFNCGHIAAFTMDNGVLGIRYVAQDEVIPREAYRVSWGIREYWRQHPRDKDELFNHQAE